jgi:hypothetical protein
MSTIGILTAARRLTTKIIILAIRPTITGPIKLFRHIVPCCNTKHEEPYIVELQTIHEKAVAILLSIPDVIKELDRLLFDPPQVTVVWRGPLLTPYYGLNRFLALLITRFIKDKFGRESLYPNTEIVNVESVDPSHAC